MNAALVITKKAFSAKMTSCSRLEHRRAFVVLPEERIWQHTMGKPLFVSPFCLSRAVVERNE